MLDDARKALHLAVKEAYDAGLCVVPPREDGSKAPETYWKQFQEERTSLEFLRNQYRNGRCGIGIVCGKVSGHLECLDFDTKDIYKLFKEACGLAGLDELLERMEAGYSEVTPNGFHLLYHVESCGRSRKLARTETFETLIEIKGEGGFAVVSPTYGAVNPDGPYIRVSGSAATIPFITMEDRGALYRVAETFDRTPKLDGLPYYNPNDGTPSGEGDRPGDDFIRRGSWDFLVEAGWTKVADGFDPEGRAQEFWRRPGKDRGNSAILHPESGLFYVFSTSTPFPVVPAAYNKFRTLVYVMFNGDFSAAVAQVKEWGFKARRKEEPVVRLEYGQTIKANLLGSLTFPDIETLPVLGRSGFFIEGGSTIFYSYPKVGKTDLSTALVGEWIREGRRVHYLSEEPLMYWQKRLGFVDDNWDRWAPLTLSEAMGWGIVKILKSLDETDVIIVDTIRSVAGYRENKVDEDVGRVVEPLILAARERGATLIANYHARKMPGEDGADISGHHSLFGAFDRAVQLKRLGGDDNDRKRRLTVFGRLLDPEIPSTLIYEMTNVCRFRPLDQEETLRVLSIVKSCKDCGAGFTADRKDAQYCSNNCRQRAKRTRETVSEKSDEE